VIKESFEIQRSDDDYFKINSGLLKRRTLEILIK
jgi:hypothetical protein